MIFNILIIDNSRDYFYFFHFWKNLDDEIFFFRNVSFNRLINRFNINNQINEIMYKIYKFDIFYRFNETIFLNIYKSFNKISFFKNICYKSYNDFIFLKLLINHFLINIIHFT